MREDIQRDVHEERRPVLSQACMPSSGADLMNFEVTGAYEDRLQKQWAGALGVAEGELSALMADPQNESLGEYFHFDRLLRSIGGTFELVVETERAMRTHLLTTSDVYESMQRAIETLFARETFARLSETGFVKSIAYDFDRLPEDLTKVSEKRKSREIHRAIKDEIFPTLISEMLGEMGMLSDRGSRGFDLLCESFRGVDGTVPAQDVQVKVLHKDSPVFNRESVIGKKQFFKLVAVLTAKTERPLVQRVLFFQHAATDHQLSELVTDLQGAGVESEQIVVIDDRQLHHAGVQIIDRASPDGLEDERELKLQVDMQQYVKSIWARDFVSQQRLADRPFELSLMRANGTFELVNYYRERLGLQPLG